MSAGGEAAAELVRRTTAAQGLPERVQDAAAIARLGALFARAEPTILEDERAS